MKKIMHSPGTRFIITFIFVFALLLNTGIVRAEQDIEAGTVIKGKSHSTLYYLGSDGKRLVFPTESTYLSWYDSFDNVMEIDDEDLAKFPLGGNVRYHPGSLLVKVKTDPRVYAVGANGTLRWIKNENLAKKLYGDKWNLLVDDIPDTFFVNYSIGDPIEDEYEFDADEEEDQITSIDHNRIAKIKKG